MAITYRRGIARFATGEFRPPGPDDPEPTGRWSVFPSSPGVLTVYAPNGWRWVPDEKPLTVLLKALAGAAVKWNGLPALVEVVEGMRRRAARPVKARQVIAVEVPDGSPLVKAPGYLDLTLGAPLRAVEVDGEPIATRGRSGSTAPRQRGEAGVSVWSYRAPPLLERARTMPSVSGRALAAYPRICFK